MILKTKKTLLETALRVVSLQITQDSLVF